MNLFTALITALITAIQIAPPAPHNEPGSDRPDGYGQGVSAMFAGAVGDTVIMAGGANFPDTPVYDGGRKRFYCEIFIKQGKRNRWEYAGMLPDPLAYGMSVATPDGVLCIGGTGSSGQSRKVFMIGTDGSIDRSWPELPAATSEGAATFCDGRIYVAGGVADGTPSTAVWMLDPDGPAPRWEAVASLPSPAVQPVMTSSGGKIYLWYGFNPASGEVSGNGISYDPATDRWTPVAPHPADGTFTGAVCATLPDGRIACAGGVDREIFSAALKYDRKQTREYQMRPQASYRFQGNLWIYDPGTDRWTDGGSDPFSLARAGAGIALTSEGLVVIEGEIKPGVRAPQIALIPFSAIP